MENQKEYELLAKKIDEGITGLSPLGKKGNIIKTWMEYLRVLVPPEDVKYLLQLEQMPNTITAKRFAKKINKSLEEALQILQHLIDNDLVLKIGSKKPKYGIPITQLLHNGPPLRYFDMPQEKAKKLAELSYKYLVKDKWFKTYAGGPQTSLLRVIPVQASIETKSSIMPYDDVAKIIDDARVVALAKCACKMRTEILGIRKCKDKYPLESCMPLNHGAVAWIERGIAREISKQEAKELAKKFNKMGLIHTLENFGEGIHSMLCNCCPCCCNPLGGILQWDNPRAVASANYTAILKDTADCTGCDTCVDGCLFQAISRTDQAPIIDPKKCMGCGVCVVNCPANIIELKTEEKEPSFNGIFELVAKVTQEINDME